MDTEFWNLNVGDTFSDHTGDIFVKTDEDHAVLAATPDSNTISFEPTDEVYDE